MNTDKPVKEKKRLLFIDMFRGIAVLWMIEAHVYHGMLKNSLKTGLLMEIISVTNGYVAVAFIFCAGAGFWLAANKKFEEYKSFQPSFWKYLSRIFMLFYLGYWLHLPFATLHQSLSMNYEQLTRFVECDVLHNIAISSVFATILLLLIPKMKYLPWISLILAMFIFGMAPIVWAQDFHTKLPIVIGTYLSHPPIAKFPIFHWSGYFFAGIAVTSFFMNSQNKKKLAYIILFSSVILAFTMLFTQHQQPKYGFEYWWDAHPGHALFRLSSILVFFMFLYLTEDLYHTKITKMLSMCGQESLFVYVFHLMIVYGSIINIGMSTFLYDKMSVLGYIGIYSLVTSFTIFITYHWNKTKKEKPRLARLLFWLLNIVFLLSYIIRQY